MEGQRPARHVDPTVLAVERVLAAERDAETRLAQCRADTKSLVAAARERAAATARRTDARISTLHTAYLLKVGNRIASLRDQQTHAGHGLFDERALAAAAERLAADLTSDR
jgi:hypothetical protein